MGKDRDAACGVMKGDAIPLVRSYRGKTFVFLLSFFCMLSSLFCCRSRGEDWEKHGDKWYFYLGPDEPLENSWVLWNERWYYIGSKGEMKTGFLTDPETGRKYYLGADGALAANRFTEDGKYYIGQDGTELLRFDSYRKKLEAALNAAMSQKGKKKKGDTAEEPSFYVVDLNRDGYRDILVGNRLFFPDHFSTVQLWDPETEKFVQLLETDADDPEIASLCWNENQAKLWYVRTDGLFRYDFYTMEPQEYRLEHIWHFDSEADAEDYGALKYFANENEMPYTDWLDLLYTVDRGTGEVLSFRYAALNKENIKAAVNSFPSEQERQMWESIELAEKS